MFPVLLWKSVVLFERGWCFGQSTVSVVPHMRHALDVWRGKAVLPKISGTWYLNFLICLSREKPNGKNKYLPCAWHYARNLTG